MFDIGDKPPEQGGGGAWAAGGPPTTWMDVARANVEVMRQADNFGARTVAASDAAQDMIDAARRVGIDDQLFSANPVQRRMSRSGFAGFDEEDPVGAWERRRLELADKHPEHRDIFKPDRSLEALAAERARAAEEAAADVTSRYGGVAPAWTASFGGSFKGSLYDPTNVLALLAGPWGRVGVGAQALVRQAILTGAVNAGTELATTPWVQMWRRDAGLDYGPGQVIERLGTAFAGGVVLDAGIRVPFRGAARGLGFVPRLDKDGKVEGWMLPRGPGETVEYRGHTYEPVVERGRQAYRYKEPSPKPTPEPGMSEADTRLPAAGEEPTPRPVATGEETPRARLPEVAARATEDAEAVDAAHASLKSYEDESGQTINLTHRERDAVARYIAKTRKEADEALGEFDALSKRKKRAFLNEHAPVVEPRAEPATSPFKVGDQAFPVTEADRQHFYTQPVRIDQVVRDPSSGETYAAFKDPQTGDPRYWPLKNFERQGPSGTTRPQRPPPQSQDEAEARLAEAARTQPPGSPVRRAFDGDLNATKELVRGTELERDEAVRGALQTAETQGSIKDPQPPMSDEADRLQRQADWLANAVDPQSNPPPVDPVPVLPQRAGAAGLAEGPGQGRDYVLDGKPITSQLLYTKDLVVDERVFQRDPARKALASTSDRWNRFFADQQGFFVYERAVPEGEGQVRFRTERGSSYTVDADGHTTRERAAGPGDIGRPGVGGPEERGGLQPRSDSRTVYVTPEAASLLSEVQTTGGHKRMLSVGALDEQRRTGKIGVRYTEGPDAGKIEHRTYVDFHMDPQVGLLPVERWSNYKPHFGNKITEVTPAKRGQMIVAEGIDRWRLASKLRHTDEHGMPIDTWAFVFKEAEGWTEAQVEALAAYKNILDGHVEPVPMATVLRTMPEMVDRAVWKTRHFNDMVKDLLRLSDEAWNIMRASETLVPPHYARLVGHHVPDPSMHAAVMTELADALKGMVGGITPSNVQQAKFLVLDHIYRQRGIDIDPARGLLTERGLVLDRAAVELAKDRSIFDVLVREFGRITEEGNVLDTGRNLARAADDEMVRAIILQLGVRPGPVRDWLADAVGRVMPLPPAGRARTAAVKTALADFIGKVKREFKENGVEALRPEAREPLEGASPAGIDDPSGARIDAQIARLQSERTAQLRQQMHDIAADRLDEWLRLFGEGRVAGISREDLVGLDRATVVRLLVGDETAEPAVGFPEAIKQAQALRRQAREAELRAEAEKAVEAARVADEAAGPAVTTANVDEWLAKWMFVDVARKMGRELSPEAAAAEADLAKAGIEKATTMGEARRILEARAAAAESRAAGEQAKPKAAGAAGGAGREQGAAQPGGPGAAGGEVRGAEAGGDEASATGEGGHGPLTRKPAILGPDDVRMGINEFIVEKGRPGDSFEIEQHSPGTRRATMEVLDAHRDLADQFEMTKATGNKGGRIGVLSKVEIIRQRPGDADVRLTFLDMDGQPFEMEMPWSEALNSHGVFDLGTSGIGLLSFGHQVPEEAAAGLAGAGAFGAPGGRNPLKSLGGPLKSDGATWLRAIQDYAGYTRGLLFHELGHRLWARLDDEARARLVGHADDLNVMKMWLGEFLSATQFEPRKLSAADLENQASELAHIYEQAYIKHQAATGLDPNAPGNIRARADALNEEKFTHMLHLAAVGVLRPQDLAAVRDLLVKHFDGVNGHMSRMLDAEPALRITGRSEVAIVPPGGPYRSILVPSWDEVRQQGVFDRRVVDALGLYQRVVEAVEKWRQRRGDAKQLERYLKKDAGVTDAEIIATGLDTLLQSKRPLAKGDVLDHLQRNRVALGERRYQGASERRFKDLQITGVTADEANGFDIHEVRDYGTDQRYSIYVYRNDGEVYVKTPAGMLLDVPSATGNPTVEDAMRAIADHAGVVEPPAGVAGAARYAAKGSALDPNNRTYAEDAINLALTPRSLAEPSAVAENPYRYLTLPREQHYSVNQGDPDNVIGHARGVLARGPGNKLHQLDEEIQVGLAQAQRDAVRTAVTQQVFGPNNPRIQARLLEIDRTLLPEAQKRFDAYYLGEPLKFLQEPDISRRKLPDGSHPPLMALSSKPDGQEVELALTLLSVANPPTHPAVRARASELLARGRKVHEEFRGLRAEQELIRNPDKKFSDLTPAQQKVVSQEIDAIRKRGEVPPGVRDEKEIARLDKRIDELIKQQQTALGEALDLLRRSPPDEVAERAAANKIELEEQMRIFLSWHSNDKNWIMRSLRESAAPEAAALAARIEEAGQQLDIANLQHLRQAGQLASHPIIATTEQSLRTMFRTRIAKAVAAGADFYSIAPGILHATDRRWGTLKGMRATYDGSYLKLIRDTLNEIIEDSYAREHMGRDFADLSPKERETLRGLIRDEDGYAKPHQDMPLKSTFDGRVFTRPGASDEFARAFLAARAGGNYERAIEDLRSILAGTTIPAERTFYADVLSKLESAERQGLNQPYQFHAFELPERVKTHVRRYGQQMFSTDPRAEAVGRQIDAIGMISQALETARDLPDGWRGTPGQVLAELKKGQVKDVEIESTYLKDFLEGKKTVSKDDLVQHLTDNRVQIEETVYGSPKQAELQAANDALVEATRALYPHMRRSEAYEYAFEIIDGTQRMPVALPGDEFYQAGLSEAMEAAAVRAREAYRSRGIEAPAKFSTREASISPGDPTAFEIVPNLKPSALGSRARVLAAELEALEKEYDALKDRRQVGMRRAGPAAQLEDSARWAAIGDRMFRLERELYDLGWTDPHYEEPANVLGQERGVFGDAEDGGSVRVTEELQPQKAETVRDRARQIVSERMFGPESEYRRKRLAEIEPELRTANSQLASLTRRWERTAGPDAELEDKRFAARQRVFELERERSDLSDTQPQPFKFLPKEQRAAVSQEIAALRQRGEVLPGVKDVREIAALEQQMTDLNARIATLRQEMGKEFGGKSKAFNADYFAGASDVDAVLHLGRVAGDHSLTAAQRAKVGERLRGYRDLLQERSFLETAIYRARNTGENSHPMVETSDPTARLMIRRAILHGAKQDVDYLALAPSDVFIARGWGTKEGMIESYDRILPKLYAEELNDVVRDSYALSHPLYRKSYTALKPEERATINGLIKSEGAEVTARRMPVKSRVDGEKFRTGKDYAEELRLETQARLDQMHDTLTQAGRDTWEFDTGGGILASHTSRADAEAHMHRAAAEDAQKALDQRIRDTGGFGVIQFHAFPMPARVKAHVLRQGIKMFSKAMPPPEEIPRAIDTMNMYSHVLETAKGLKQEKGTPDQFFNVLAGSPGVRVAEIEATNLDKFLLGDDLAGQWRSLNRMRNAISEKQQEITEKLPKLERPEGMSDKDWSAARKARQAEVAKELEDLQKPFDAAEKEFKDGLAREFGKRAGRNEPVRTVSRQEIIDHLTENRIGLKETVYGGPDADRIAVAQRRTSRAANVEDEVREQIETEVRQNEQHAIEERIQQDLYEEASEDFYHNFDGVPYRDIADELSRERWEGPGISIGGPPSTLAQRALELVGGSSRREAKRHKVQFKFDSRSSEAGGDHDIIGTFRVGDDEVTFYGAVHDRGRGIEPAFKTLRELEGYDRDSHAALLRIAEGDAERAQEILDELNEALPKEWEDIPQYERARERLEDSVREEWERDYVQHHFRDRVDEAIQERVDEEIERRLDDLVEQRLAELAPEAPEGEAPTAPRPGKYYNWSIENAAGIPESASTSYQSRVVSVVDSAAMEKARARLKEVTPLEEKDRAEYTRLNAIIDAWDRGIAGNMEGHFSDPEAKGYVFHTRISVHVDKDGKKVLLVDELQFTLAQALREVGGPRDEARVAQLERQHREAVAAVDSAVSEAQHWLQGNAVARGKDIRYGPHEIYSGLAEAHGSEPGAKDFRGDSMIEGAFKRMNAYNKAIERRDRLSTDLQNEQRKSLGHPIINAPDRVVRIAMGYILNQGVKLGVDRIAFTPGRVQKDRYAISQVAEALRYNPDTRDLQYLPAGPGRSDHWSTDHWSTVHGQGGSEFKPEDLPGTIGRELSERLLATPREGDYGGWHTLRDIGNLELGNEDMRAPYERIYPKALIERLREYDKEGTKGAGRTELFSTYNQQAFKHKGGNQETIQFPVVDLTDKAKTGVERGGIRMFSTDPRAPVGAEQRVEFDSLGYYSAALEAVKSLDDKWKGTFEQAREELKKRGVKDAELRTVGLEEFLDRRAERAAVTPAKEELAAAGFDTNRVLYHGTKKAIPEFKDGILWLFPEAERADFFNEARQWYGKETAEGGMTYPVYIRPGKQLVIDAEGKRPNLISKMLKERAAAEGYDSAVIRNLPEKGGVAKEVVVVFKKKDVRSATAPRAGTRHGELFDFSQSGPRVATAKEGGAQVTYARSANPDEYYVGVVWTEEAARRQGRSRALMQKLIDHADAEDKSLRLMAGDEEGIGFDNIRKFYRSLGFKEIGPVIPGRGKVPEHIEMVRPSRTGKQGQGRITPQGVAGLYDAETPLAEMKPETAALVHEYARRAKDRQSITKQQLETFLRENRAELKEARYGSLRETVNKDSPYGIPEVLRAIDRSGEFDRDLLTTLASDGDAYRALMRRFPELRGNEDWAEVVTNDLVGGDTRPDMTAAYTNNMLEPDNPTNRHVVVHMPGPTETPLYTALGRDADALRNVVIGEPAREGYAGYAPGRTIQQQLDEIYRQQEAVKSAAYQGGHFTDQLNVVGFILSSLQKLYGKVAYAISQIQSDWGQGLLDRVRNATADQLFGPGTEATKAKIAKLASEEAELEARARAEILKADKALDELGIPKLGSPMTGNENMPAMGQMLLNRMPATTSSGPRTIRAREIIEPAREAYRDHQYAANEHHKAQQAVEFDDLTPDQKKLVSKAIADARKRGEVPAGARDERKIAELRKKADEGSVGNDKLLAEAVAFASPHDKLLAETAGNPTTWTPHLASIRSWAMIGEALDRIGTPEAQAWKKRLADVRATRTRLMGELSAAEASVPSHPFIDTTSQWLDTTLGRAITDAVAADAEYITLPTGKTVLGYNPGDEHGMEGFYDHIAPIALENRLNDIVKDAYARKLYGSTTYGVLTDAQKGAVNAAARADNAFVEAIEVNPRVMDPAIEADQALDDSGHTAFRLTEPIKAHVRRSGLRMFSTDPRSTAPRLTVVHNLSEENLAEVDKLGGLAAPSLGVLREGLGMENFGEISLIGSPALGDPRRVPIHDADAWTARFPEPQYKAVPVKVADKATKELASFDTSAKFNDSSASQIWHYMRENVRPQKAIEIALHSEATQATFLKAKGIDVEPVMRQAVLHNSWVDTDAFREFIQANGWDNNARFGSAYWKKLSRAALKAIDENVERSLDRRAADISGLSPEDLAGLDDIHAGLVADYRSQLFNDKKQLHFGPAMWISDDLRKVGKQEINPGATRTALETAIAPHSGEFKSWIESKLLPGYGEPYLKVKGRNAAWNLPNIVEHMTGRRVKGKEQGMFFTEGSARAGAAKRFDDLEQMRRFAAEHILPDSEVSAARDRAQKLMETWRHDLQSHWQYYDASRFGSAISAWEGAMRAIARWARKGKTEQNLARELYREDFRNVPQHLLEEGVEAGNAFLKAPVPYFEAKPQRAVSLDEFVGAVIPENSTPETRAILEKHGLTIATYDKKAGRGAKEAAAVELARRLGPKAMFSTEGEKPRVPGRPVVEPTSRRTPRMTSVPKEAGEPIVSLTDAAVLKAHASFKAARRGDREAAATLVTDLVKDDDVAAANARFGDHAIYLPMRVASNAGTPNEIPAAMAERYAIMSDQPVDDKIVQLTTAHPAGAKQLERMIARPLFDGPVQAGKRYVIVDDIATHGDTHAELAHYVTEHGGEVAGVVLLADARKTKLYAAGSEDIQKVRKLHGPTVRDQLGIEPSALTADEAAEILKRKNPDALRSAINTAEGGREQRLLQGEVPEAEVGAEGAAGEPGKVAGKQRRAAVPTDQKGLLVWIEDGGWQHHNPGQMGGHPVYAHPIIQQALLEYRQKHGEPMRGPDGKPETGKITIGSTPSESRSIKNTVALFRRMEERFGIKRDADGKLPKASIMGASSARGDTHVALEAAQTMERAGRSPDEIRLATGWERFQGKWLHRFSDEALKMRPEGREALKRGGTLPAATAFAHSEMWRRFPELAHLDVEMRRKRGIGDVTATRQAGFGGEGGQQPGAPAYADLPETAGQRARMTIVASTPKEAENKFLNEMQRFIARREGLPEGGSPVSGMADADRIRQSLDNQLAAAVERYDTLGPDVPPAERQALVAEVGRLLGAARGLDGVTPPEAYERLPGTQLGRATVAQRGLSEGELRATPLRQGMTVPPEQQLPIERGPSRQFGTETDDTPRVPADPQKGVFAVPAAVQGWAGLSDHPLKANLNNIAKKRRGKTPPGFYGPGADLDRVDLVRAHIALVLSDPDIAWVKADRSGTFSLQLIKLGERYDRTVAISLAIPEDGVREVKTAFNQTRLETAVRLAAALDQEGIDRVKWPTASANHQGLLRLIEQVPKGKRKPSWQEFKDRLGQMQPASARGPQSPAFVMRGMARLGEVDPRSPLADPRVAKVIREMAGTGMSMPTIAARIRSETGAYLSAGQVRSAVHRLRLETQAGLVQDPMVDVRRVVEALTSRGVQRSTRDIISTVHELTGMKISRKQAAEIMNQARDSRKTAADPIKAQSAEAASAAETAEFLQACKS